VKYTEAGNYCKPSHFISNHLEKSGISRFVPIQNLDNLDGFSIARMFEKIEIEGAPLALRI
jgi:hypothetical protein